MARYGLLLVLLIGAAAAEDQICGGPGAGDFMVVQTEEPTMGIAPAFDFEGDFLETIPVLPMPLNDIKLEGYDPVERKVYGVRSDQISADYRVVRFNTDGTELEDVFTYDKNLQDVILDLDERVMYIATRDAIYSANITAGLTKDNVTTVTFFEVEGIVGKIAFDPVARRMYYSFSSMTVIPYWGSVSVDNSSDITTLVETYYQVFAVAPEERKLYRIEQIGKLQYIFETDLDGVSNIMNKSITYGNMRDLVVYDGALVFLRPDARLVFEIPFDGSDDVLDSSDIGYNNVVFYNIPASEPPVPTQLKIRQQNAFRGGLILKVDTRITSEMSSWVLDVHFPRNVFNLKLVGCKALIQKKTITTPDGPRRRKAATYRLVSDPDDPTSVPAVGEKLSIKMTASSWGPVRRMERGIVGELYTCE